MKEIFSDGVADILVSNGLAYIDFFHLVPGPNGRSVREKFLCITLPVTSFGLFGLIDTGKVAILITSATAAVVGYLIFSATANKLNKAKTTDNNQ